jgi:regulator of cell morphogenesis and NO signaling
MAMSATTIEKTVRELALEVPAATRVFERLHIDYCCGGGRTLDDACRAAGVAVEQVVAALESGGAPAAGDRDWSNEPLGELVDHIRNTHHVYTRDAIARIPALIAKVAAAHGERHPELARIQTVFDGLAQELAMHMMKEEMVLFPHIVRMEEASLAGEPPVPPPFGTVRNPVRMMEHEHDSAGDALRELSELSNGYTTPADGCLSYRTLYGALAEFEQDLHQHIHLENNVLFPRAIAMEG